MGKRRRGKRRGGKGEGRRGEGGRGGGGRGEGGRGEGGKEKRKVGVEGEKEEMRVMKEERRIQKRGEVHCKKEEGRKIHKPFKFYKLGVNDLHVHVPPLVGLP